MADSFAAQLADALGASWPAIARPNQLPPPGEWQVWRAVAVQPAFSCSASHSIEPIAHAVLVG